MVYGNNIVYFYNKADLQCITLTLQTILTLSVYGQNNAVSDGKAVQTNSCSSNTDNTCQSKKL